MARKKSVYDFSFVQAKVALEIAGLSQTDLAGELGVTPQSVHCAMKNPRHYTRIAARIDQLITAANELMNIEALRHVS